MGYHAIPANPVHHLHSLPVRRAHLHVSAVGLAILKGWQRPTWAFNFVVMPLASSENIIRPQQVSLP